MQGAAPLVLQPGAETLHGRGGAVGEGMSNQRLRRNENLFEFRSNPQDSVRPWQPKVAMAVRGVASLRPDERRRDARSAERRLNRRFDKARQGMKKVHGGKMKK